MDLLNIPIGRTITAKIKNKTIGEIILLKKSPSLNQSKFGNLNIPGFKYPNIKKNNEINKR